MAIKIFGKIRQTLESFGTINPDKCKIIPEKSFPFPGKIVINPVVSKYSTGMIVNSTGRIDSVIGKIIILSN